MRGKAPSQHMNARMRGPPPGVASHSHLTLALARRALERMRAGRDLLLRNMEALDVYGPFSQQETADVANYTGGVGPAGRSTPEAHPEVTAPDSPL